MFGKKKRYREEVWAALSHIGLGPDDFPSMNPIIFQIDQAYDTQLHQCEAALMLFYSIAQTLKEQDSERFDIINASAQLHEVVWAGRQWVRPRIVLEWREIAGLT